MGFVIHFWIVQATGGGFSNNVLIVTKIGVQAGTRLVCNKSHFVISDDRIVNRRKVSAAKSCQNLSSYFKALVCSLRDGQCNPGVSFLVYYYSDEKKGGGGFMGLVWACK